VRVLLALHGYPPELVGGTESAVQSLARGLVARGHDVLVVAGSMRHEPGLARSEETQPDGVRVVRLHRPDLFFDHWQKSFSPDVAEGFAAELARFRPDVVHVHHWIRMTRDLVAIAARAGVPAAVTLHDFWPSCLVTFRVRPDTHAACDVPLAPEPCLACAALVPPRTPWRDRAQQMIALLEHKGDLARELELARAVLAPTRTHADAVAGFLGLDAERLGVRVVPNGRELALAPRAPDAVPGKLVLATWGNLHPLKGVDVILDALRRLPDPARVELRVAGAPVSADHERRLRALAEGLAVTFHGAYDVDALGAHPAGGAAVMVSGSRARESYGLVADEACALGMAMVLPRAGAFAERLAEGVGCRFYAPGDAADLARVLAELADSPADVARLRASVPPRAELLTTLDQHVEQVLAAYADVRVAGAPGIAQRDWWDLRLAREATAEWDRRLASTPPEELGLA
jgi:glycosyltransferase involved in cell wall biosynthesis